MQFVSNGNVTEQVHKMMKNLLNVPQKLKHFH